MIFSRHALLRFVQRIIGIVNEQKALEFLEKNEYEVYYKLLKLINESEVLYERFSPHGAGETFKYLLNGDTLIVISPVKNIVITLYDISVDLNEVDNSEKIRQYARKIKRNKGEVLKKNAKKNENDKESRNLEFLVEHMEKELETLKQQLEEKINIGKEIAAETKKLRHENRDLMTKIMFGFKEFL